MTACPINCIPRYHLLAFVPNHSKRPKFAHLFAFNSIISKSKNVLPATNRVQPRSIGFERLICCAMLARSDMECNQLLPARQVTRYRRRNWLSGKLLQGNQQQPTAEREERKSKGNELHRRGPCRHHPTRPVCSPGQMPPVKNPSGLPNMRPYRPPCRATTKPTRIRSPTTDIPLSSPKPRQKARPTSSSSFRP